jgi:hypothetical protein
LTLKAATPGSGVGITHQSGTLFVENTIVDGWVTGLLSNATAEKLFVKGSVFRNQTIGLWVIGDGSEIISVDRSSFLKNSVAGLYVTGAKGRVSNSVMSGNQLGGAVNGGTAGATINFQRCEVSSNTNQGLWATNGSTLRVSESTIVRNGTGVENDADTATVESFDNNVIRGNVGGNNIAGTVTTVSLQ